MRKPCSQLQAIVNSLASDVCASPVKPLSDEIGHQEADREDDEHANPEEEQLMVSDEVYHGDAIAQSVKRYMLI